MDTNLLRDTSMIKFSWRSNQFLEMSQIKNSPLSHVEESFKKILDPDSEADDFLDVINYSFSKNTSLLRFSWKSDHEYFYVKLVTNKQADKRQYYITSLGEIINKLYYYLTYNSAVNEDIFFLLKTISIKTRCSAIAERPRCRVRYSFRQK